MRALGEQTKTMAMSVTSMLKTVSSVEDEQTRVSTALTSAIDAIKTELR